MSPSNSPQKSSLGEPMLEAEETSSSGRKIPSLSSLFHILWLRKWIAFGIWLVLAIPAGIALSIYDLPRSYTATTVMRFPQVVGAQTNVMRDVAITEGQSIITIFNSYQVLDATIQKLGLRLRLKSPEAFRRDIIKDAHYSDALGPGTYTVQLEKGGRSGSISYKPKDATNEYKIFSGPVGKDGRIAVTGLELTFTPEYLANADGKQLGMELKSEQECLEDLRKALTARSLGGGGNFEIHLKDRDPYLVADILNTLREQFLEVYYGTTEVQDVGILVQMEKDLELAKQRLEKSQDDVSKFYAAHPELVQQPPTSGDNLAYLESRQQSDELERRRRRVVEAYAAKDTASSPEKAYFWASEMLSTMSEAGEPKADILRASLAEIESRESNYARTLAPEHPKIKEVESEKAALYKQIELAEGALIRQLDQQIADLKVRAAASAPRNASRPPIKVTLELERLNNTNQNNQNIYDRLLESYNRAKLVTGSEFFKVSVVDPARPAIYEPPSLRMRLIIAAAAVMILMLLVPGLVMGWSALFVRLWTKDDMRRLLDLRTLGVLPLRKLRKVKIPRKPAESPDSSGSLRRPSLDPLLLVHGSASILEDIEAYRAIREETENLFRNPSRPGRYCFMVTSCRPHEGKSTTAANLAITFARKGKRTLLVDADFRLGRVARMFGLYVATGIDTLLDQADISASEFLESAALAFQPTAQMNLVVAPSRSPKANASELISSDRFKSFINLARDQFDIVILDTSPVMITPEPLALAGLADGIIFVCRSGMTSAAEAREAIEALGGRNERIAAVLNGVKASPFEGNRYQKYSYYYKVQPDPKAGSPGA